MSDIEMNDTDELLRYDEMAIAFHEHAQAMIRSGEIFLEIQLSLPPSKERDDLIRELQMNVEGAKGLARNWKLLRDQIQRDLNGPH